MYEPGAGPRPVHGSIRPGELRALGLRPEDVLDFSASISPLGPPGGVWNAMRRVDLATYPDPECLELREAISRHLSEYPSIGGRAVPWAIPIERIQVGNGSTEIFHLLARAWLSPSHRAVILTPTYGEYLGACQLTGAPVVMVQADTAGDLRWDLGQAASVIEEHCPALVFLCNPNNPTGVYLREAEVAGLADAAERAGGLMIVDEAYLSFVGKPWDSLKLLERENVVLVRSMTKDYAQTGLRLGYAVAAEPVVARLRAFQPDWSVNSLAQAAGIAALADAEYLPRARQAVFRAKLYLIELLASLGFETPPSEANFLLVKVGDGPAWRSRLLSRGIVVRDCTSFGLPEYIRIGIRSLPDCQRLAEAMSVVSKDLEEGLAAGLENG